MFTTSGHITLFWARLNQTASAHPISLRSIFLLALHICRGFKIIFFFHLSSPKLCVNFSSSTYLIHYSPIHLSLIQSPEYVKSCTKYKKLHIMQFSPVSCYFLSYKPNYFPQHPIFNCPQPVFSLETKFHTHIRLQEKL